MPLKLVVFDLDGTLADTSADITNALNYATEPFGLPPLDIRDTVGLVGEGTARLIEKVLGSERAALKGEVLERFLRHYGEHLADFTSLYPGVRETLEKLGGLGKAVISNKDEALSRRLLEALGIAGFFSIVVGSDTVSEKKPSPLPVRHVLSALGVDAGEAIMVGDSGYDIEAARGAGLRAVAVTYGYRDREALKGADYMIDGMAELLPLLYGSGLLADRRRDKRYRIPEIYQKYISLKLATEEGYVEAALFDFSEHGIKIISPVPLAVGALQGCLVSAPASLSKEVSFAARIRQCFEHEGWFIAGAEIEEIHDEVWFRVFKKVHDFIHQRVGEVF